MLTASTRRVQASRRLSEGHRPKRGWASAVPPIQRFLVVNALEGIDEGEFPDLRTWHGVHRPAAIVCQYVRRHADSDIDAHGDTRNAARAVAQDAARLLPRRGGSLQWVRVQHGGSAAGVFNVHCSRSRYSRKHTQRIIPLAFRRPASSRTHTSVLTSRFVHTIQCPYVSST